MSISSSSDDALDDEIVRASVQKGIGRDLSDLRIKLDHWLKERLQQPEVRIEEIEVPLGTGASSDLFFIKIVGLDEEKNGHNESYVLRVASRFPVYPLVDMSLQFRCSQAASEAGALVPHVRWLETDDSVLGGAFIIMDRATGRGVSDSPPYVREGWLHDLSTEDQRSLWLNGIQSIASVHLTDVSETLAEMGQLAVAGKTPLERMLGYWRVYRDFIGEEWSLPVIDSAIAYLENNKPATQFTPSLVWGDASLRNMLFDGLAPSALLDFEFSHVGIAEFDVAFYSLMDRVVAEGFFGLPRLKGFPGVNETFDFYEDVIGRKVVDREYLTIMASTYSALATTKVFQRMHSKGQVPAELVGTHGAMKILAAITDHRVS